MNKLLEEIEERRSFIYDSYVQLSVVRDLISKMEEDFPSEEKVITPSDAYRFKRKAVRFYEEWLKGGKDNS